MSNRREFITLLGRAAAAWPLAARAQQGGHMRRIGVLVNLPADDPESQARVGAFLQGLQQFGWAIGRNVRVEYRWATDVASISRYAAELIALAPDVILVNANPSVEALQRATRTLPIVFVAVTDVRVRADARGTGIVATGRFVNRSLSCIAACWLSSGT